MNRPTTPLPKIQNPRLKELLAPTIQRHPFGCKRISLENGYFEVFNEPHVHLVDVNETPVERVTERGIKTSEKEWEFDYVVCATGYDAVTGGLLDMNIRGEGGVLLNDRWQERLATLYGMSVSSFPNMFAMSQPFYARYTSCANTDDLGSSPMDRKRQPPFATAQLVRSCKASGSLAP